MVESVMKIPWGKIARGAWEVGKVAAPIAAAGYVVNNYVSKVMSMPPNEAIQTHMANVCSMNDDVYQAVQGMLGMKANQSELAGMLHGAGQLMRRELQNVAQLTQHSIQDGIDIVIYRAGQLSEVEQFAFFMALRHLSQNNMKLQAVVGGLQQRLQS